MESPRQWQPFKIMPPLRASTFKGWRG